MLLSFYSYVFLWIICFEQALLLSVDVLSSTNYMFSGTIISLDCNYKGPIVGKWHVWAKVGGIISYASLYFRSVTWLFGSVTVPLQMFYVSPVLD